MKYRNKINGNIIDVCSEISGVNWEQVDEKAEGVKNTSSAATKRSKKTKVKEDE